MCIFTCSSIHLRRIFYVLHLLFAASGLVLITLGIWRCASNDSIEEGLNLAKPTLDIARNVDLCLILLGGFVFALGMMACRAAWKEAAGCVSLHTGITTCIVITEVLLVVLSFGMYRVVVLSLETQIHESMNAYGLSNRTETADWDNMQTKLVCCGVEDPSDWKTTPWNNQTEYHTDKVPLSCCHLGNVSTPLLMRKNVGVCFSMAYDRNATDRGNWVHTKGCGTKLMDIFVDNLWLALYIMIGTISVQLTIIAISQTLRCCVKTGRITVHGEGYLYSSNNCIR